MAQTTRRKTPRSDGIVVFVLALGIRILGLFRISCFGFRILKMRSRCRLEAKTRIVFRVTEYDDKRATGVAEAGESRRSRSTMFASVDWPKARQWTVRTDSMSGGSSSRISSMG